MKKIFFLYFIISYFILTTSIALAQNSYSWIEADGITVYGTNPPANASGVKKLKTRKLSTYSSKKLLEKITPRASLKNSALKDLESLSTFENPQTKTSKKNNSVTNQELKKIDSEVKEIVRGAKLNESKIKLILDEDDAKVINNCKLDLTNTGTLDATEVEVAFEFRDGTLIAAVGPSTLKIGETKTFKMATDLLPFRLNFALSRKKPEKEFKVRISHN